MFLLNFPIFSDFKNVSLLRDKICSQGYLVLGNYPPQQVFWTAGRGWGLRALVPIKEVNKSIFCLKSNKKYSRGNLLMNMSGN